jgi:hypothetical protein
MKTGCFTDAEAREIANADQGVDENPNTKPGFGGNTVILDPLALGFTCIIFQDTFSHRNFTDPLYGHSPAHGGSHADDKTDENVERSMEMAMGTFDALLRFAKQTGRMCKCTPGPDWQQVRRFAEAPGGNAITRRTHDIEHRRIAGPDPSIGFSCDHE